MPPVVVPFNMSPRSFVVAMFVIFFMLSLFFIIVGVLLGRSGWWKRFCEWIVTPSPLAIHHPHSSLRERTKIWLLRGRTKHSLNIDDMEKAVYV